MLATRKRTYGNQGARGRSVSSKRPSKRGRILPNFRKLRSNVVSARAQSTRVTLYYAETGVAINPGVGVAGSYVFAANGLYDPNITGVGHQPTGFDQYMALYNEYVVLGSTIKVSFASADGTNVSLIGIFLEDFSTTDLDWRRYVENGNGVWSHLDKTSSGAGCKILTHSADISKFSTQGIYSDDNFSGTASANPGDTHFYHVVVAPFDGTADNASVYINVEIRYDVIFRDPALTALS